MVSVLYRDWFSGIDFDERRHRIYTALDRRIQCYHQQMLRSYRDAAMAVESSFSTVMTVLPD